MNVYFKRLSFLSLRNYAIIKSVAVLRYMKYSSNLKNRIDYSVAVAIMQPFSEASNKKYATK